MVGNASGMMRSTSATNSGENQWLRSAQYFCIPGIPTRSVIAPQPLLEFGPQAHRRGPHPREARCMLMVWYRTSPAAVSSSGNALKTAISSSTLGESVELAPTAVGQSRLQQGQ